LSTFGLDIDRGIRCSDEELSRLLVVGVFSPSVMPKLVASDGICCFGSTDDDSPSSSLLDAAVGVVVVVSPAIRWRRRARAALFAAAVDVFLIVDIHLGFLRE
jgi:hypothetical protein